MNALLGEDTSLLLKKYFEVFLHPFRTQSALRRARIEKQNSISKIGGTNNQPIDLSLTETTSISWLFAIFRTFYTVVSIKFGYHILNMIDSDSKLKTLFLPNIKFSGQRVVLLLVLLEIVLFPILVYFYVKLSTVVIRFFSDLFETNTPEETIEQTISHSLSANILLIVPIFGGFLRLLMTSVHLFAGLRNNFGMTRMQSSVIMISPLFMLVGFVLINFLYLIMVFSLL
ncbi:MAG: hypothetical protein HN576_11260 [Bacteriovoracaceae bacterium]|jgi:hypothetical protein|nr:hypothetical protein [Bacteriovoracaceae bacterium]